MMRRCMNCMEEHKAGATVCTHCGWDTSAVPQQDRNLPVGTLLEERYQLGMVLGAGGFGITYIAYDQKLGRKVAIKEFFPSDFATRQVGSTKLSVFTGDAATYFAKAKEGFIQESRSLAAFANFSNIVTIHDSFEANGTAYIVMEYLKGQTLKELLKVQGKLSFPDALTLIVPVLETLETVHKAGIIHRDVSPDNIFIRTDGSVALIDFGAARTYASDVSKSMTVVLKPGYAPLEQYHSKGVQGPWTDVYAVAATIYRTITGISPEESVQRTIEDTLKPPSAFGVEIPKASEDALMAALAVQPTGRIHSASELLARLFELTKTVTFPHAPQPQIFTPTSTRTQGEPLVNKSPDTSLIILEELKVGDIVSFGELAFETHKFTNSCITKTENYGEFLWRVLQVYEDMALVISEDIIAREPYNEESVDITWEKSDIRTWLNNNFFESLPLDIQDRIVAVNKLNNNNPKYATRGGNDTDDWIFILSTSEAKGYFGSNESRMSVVDIVDDDLDGEINWWWLRSPGFYRSYATGVFGDGNILYAGYSVDNDSGGVRPAFWLSL